MLTNFNKSVWVLDLKSRWWKKDRGTTHNVKNMDEGERKCRRLTRGQRLEEQIGGKTNIHVFFKENIGLRLYK